MPLPSNVGTANVDAGTDDPKQALLTDTKAAIDALNALIDFLETLPIVADGLTIGAGLESAGGALRALLTTLYSNASQALAAGYPVALSAIAFSSSVEPDFTEGALQTLAVTGDFTLVAPSNTPGGVKLIKATIDATGNRNLALDAGYKTIFGEWDGGANAVNDLLIVDWGGGDLHVAIMQAS